MLEVVHFSPFVAPSLPLCPSVCLQCVSEGLVQEEGSRVKIFSYFSNQMKNTQNKKKNIFSYSVTCVQTKNITVTVNVQII